MSIIMPIEQAIVGFSIYVIFFFIILAISHSGENANNLFFSGKNNFNKVTRKK